MEDVMEFLCLKLKIAILVFVCIGSAEASAFLQIANNQSTLLSTQKFLPYAQNSLQKQFSTTYPFLPNENKPFVEKQQQLPAKTQDFPSTIDVQNEFRKTPSFKTFGVSNKIKPNETVMATKPMPFPGQRNFSTTANVLGNIPTSPVDEIRNRSKGGNPFAGNVDPWLLYLKTLLNNQQSGATQQNQLKQPVQIIEQKPSTEGKKPPQTIVQQLPKEENQPSQTSSEKKKSLKSKKYQPRTDNKKKQQEQQKEDEKKQQTGSEKYQQETGGKKQYAWYKTVAYIIGGYLGGETIKKVYNDLSDKFVRPIIQSEKTEKMSPNKEISDTDKKKLIEAAEDSRFALFDVLNKLGKQYPPNKIKDMLMGQYEGKVLYETLVNISAERGFIKNIDAIADFLVTNGGEFKLPEDLLYTKMPTDIPSKAGTKVRIGEVRHIDPAIINYLLDPKKNNAANIDIKTLQDFFFNQTYLDSCLAEEKPYLDIWNAIEKKFAPGFLSSGGKNPFLTNLMAQHLHKAQEKQRMKEIKKQEAQKNPIENLNMPKTPVTQEQQADSEEPERTDIQEQQKE